MKLPVIAVVGGTGHLGHALAQLLARAGYRVLVGSRTAAVLMLSVVRLVLHPHFINVQTSWVKMGPQGAAFCLRAGANDLGGTLMNESITRAAGGVNGQELSPDRMGALAQNMGRALAERTTLYERRSCQ